MDGQSGGQVMRPGILVLVLIISGFSIGCGEDLPEGVVTDNTSQNSVYVPPPADPLPYIPTIPTVDLNVTASTVNYNIFAAAGSPTEPVIVTLRISAGVTIGSASTSLPALKTGIFPFNSQIIIINAGDILGAGGLGKAAQEAGLPGGPALSLETPVSITNTGHIFGGGGGGGGGVNFLLAGGTGGNGCGSNFSTLASATIGYPNTGFVYGYNGNGGDGGCWGQPGGTSTGAGGAAGAAIITNGNSITWSEGNTPALVKGSIL